MRSWVAALGGEVVLYEADLPVCCRRSAGGGASEDFECLSCGAVWQAVGPVEPEEDAFTARRERRGAA